MVSGYNIYIPHGLVVLIVMFIIGFGLSMIGTVRTKKARHNYQKLDSIEVLEGRAGSDNHPSYQNAGPPKQNVTYSVIDERLR